MRASKASEPRERSAPTKRRLILTLAIAFGATIAAAPGSPQTQPPQRRMSIHNRLLLNRAAVGGLPRVELLLLADPGDVDQVSAIVERAGGRVGKREPRIGYVRAEVPLDQVAAIAGDPAIEAWHIATDSRKAWYRDGPPLSNAAMYRGFETLTPARTAPVDSIDLPELPTEIARASGFTADEDSGLAEWRRRHPDFDGRGVTIAMIESGLPDFGHPAIGRALTLDGRDVPKLAGLLNAIEPDRHDATRVRLDQELHVARSWARVGARTYIFPGAGDYRFGLFDLPSGGNLAQQFGVIEHAGTREIRVDTNGDGDFRDEPPIADVNDRPDVRALTTLPPPSVRLPFVIARGVSHGVSRGPAPHTVHIYPATGSHLTMTLSVAAGSRNALNLVPGVAPNARVLIVHAETRLVDYVEGFLAAAGREDVDIINDSTGVTLLPETGGDFIGRFLTRLARTYGKVILHAANNTQLILHSASTPGDVLSVGGTMGPATLAALFGGRLEDLIVHPTGAAGPGMDGSVRPDVIAPVHVVSADLRSNDKGIGLPGRAPRWRLPAGYQISCCTSSSSPYAAGLAALLVSGARQSGLPFTAESIVRAIRFGARFLTSAPAHQQGNGVFDVNAAWSELQQTTDVPRIESAAAIVHPLAPYAAEGAIGTGILERDGWRAGMSGRRTIRLRRLSGARGNATYRVSWTGNDGTFRAPPAITLPLESTVTLPIEITARTAGAHSALLSLHDPASGAVIFRTQATIIVPHDFDGPTPSLTVRGAIATMREQSHYFRVPGNVDSMTVRLHVTSGRLKAALVPSHGVFPSYYSHLHPSISRQFERGTYVIRLARPLAGVWAIGLINDSIRREAAGTDARADYSIDISLDETAIRARRLRDRAFALDVQNTRSAPAEPAIAYAFGNLTSERAAFLHSGLPNQFAIDVPEGTGAVTIRVRSENGTPLDLHLYDCSAGECFSYAFTMPASTTQILSVRRPRAGRWVAAVSAAPAVSSIGSFVVETIVMGPEKARLAMRGMRPRGARWTREIETESIPNRIAGASRVVLFELFDDFLDRAELGHPWEQRPNVERLADRPVSIGSCLYRID